jgi:hypothetical protein
MNNSKYIFKHGHPPTEHLFEVDDGIWLDRTRWVPFMHIQDGIINIFFVQHEFLSNYQFIVDWYKTGQLRYAHLQHPDVDTYYLFTRARQQLGHGLSVIEFVYTHREIYQLAGVEAFVSKIGAKYLQYVTKYTSSAHYGAQSVSDSIYRDYFLQPIVHNLIALLIYAVAKNTDLNLKHHKAQGKDYYIGGVLASKKTVYRKGHSDVLGEGFPEQPKFFKTQEIYILGAPDEFNGNFDEERVTPIDGGQVSANPKLIKDTNIIERFTVKTDFFYWRNKLHKVYIHVYRYWSDKTKSWFYITLVDALPGMPKVSDALFYRIDSSIFSSEHWLYLLMRSGIPADKIAISEEEAAQMAYFANADKEAE